MSADVVGAVVGLVIALIGVVLVRELRERRREDLRIRLIAVFAPAIAQARADPRGLVAWAEVARGYPQVVSGGLSPARRGL